MRYERLALEADGTTLTLEFHPRLTVFAGVGPQERTALASELLSALRSSRPGVHLEVVDDADHHLAIFRPDSGRGRVIDVDQAIDRTGDFVDANGAIDLLSATGLDLATTRRKLVLRPADLDTEQNGDVVVTRLAAVDQGKLWVAAEKLLRAERTLDAESRSLGSTAEDAGIIERVEERQRQLERATERHDGIRKLSMAICAVALAGGLAAALNGQAPVAIGLLLAACLSMLGAVHTRSRATSAGKAAEVALAEAGVSSYLGFHVQRVEGMLSGEHARKHLVELAAEARRTAEVWHALAGDVPPMWALDHYEEIAAAAATRREIDLRAKSTFSIDLDQMESASDPARVLVDRITELARLGEGNESLPLILDDPFTALDPAARPAILELLSNAAARLQIIYLTCDQEVASWARVEALTGALSIIEPRPAAAPPANQQVAQPGQ